MMRTGERRSRHSIVHEPVTVPCSRTSMSSKRRVARGEYLALAALGLLVLISTWRIAGGRCGAGSGLRDAVLSLVFVSG